MDGKTGTATFAELTTRFRASLAERLATGTPATQERLRPQIESALSQIVKLCPLVAVPVVAPHHALRQCHAPSMPHPEGFFLVAATPRATTVVRFNRWPPIEAAGNAITDARMGGLLWAAMARMIEDEDIDALMIMLTARLGADGCAGILDSFQAMRDQGHTPAFVICVDDVGSVVVGMAAPLPLPPSVESYYGAGPP